MALELSSVRTKAGHVFTGFTNGQKAMLVVATIGVLAGGIFLMSWAQQPEYVVLYTSLSPADAGAMQQKLDEMKVPVQLSDGGTTIKVPREQVNKARIDLASQGLPAESKGGWALFDKQGLTTSQLQQQVAFQRALEGEIAKAIESMSAVKSATVHLAIPKQDVFADEDKEAKASVLVTLKAGEKLRSQQVSAIANLVSNAVENLPQDNVTIADSSGSLLKGTGDFVGGSGGGGDDAQAQAADAYESRIEQKVTELVETLVGPGNARVSIAADLNFDKKNTTTKQTTVLQDPLNPITSQQSTETLNGTGSGVGGQLGATVPGVGSGTDGTTAYNKTESATLNPWSEVLTEVQQAPGTVDRLTVAVVMNSNTKASPAPQGPEVQKLVTAAVGADVTRGDQVIVQSMPFDKTEAKRIETETKEQQAEKSQDELLGYAKTGVLVLAALVVLLLVRRSLRGPKTAKVKEINLREIEGKSEELKALAGAQDALDAAEAAAALPAGPSAEDVRRQKELESKRAELRQEVTEFIEHQPEEVAQLLRSWLADRA